MNSLVDSQHLPLILFIGNVESYLDQFHSDGGKFSSYHNGQVVQIKRIKYQYAISVIIYWSLSLSLYTNTHTHDMAKFLTMVYKQHDILEDWSQKQG